MGPAQYSGAVQSNQGIYLVEVAEVLVEPVFERTDSGAGELAEVLVEVVFERT